MSVKIMTLHSLLLQMEEKRRKYSVSSDTSDTTDSKALKPGSTGTEVK